MTDRKD